MLSARETGRICLKVTISIALIPDLSRSAGRNFLGGFRGHFFPRNMPVSAKYISLHAHASVAAYVICSSVSAGASQREHFVCFDIL